MIQGKLGAAAHVIPPKKEDKAPAKDQADKTPVEQQAGGDKK